MNLNFLSEDEDEVQNNAVKSSNSYASSSSLKEESEIKRAEENKLKDEKKEEELLLLQAISLCGIGNWIDISNQIKTKSPIECEIHYFYP